MKILNEKQMASVAGGDPYWCRCDGVLTAGLKTKSQCRDVCCGPSYTFTTTDASPPRKGFHVQPHSQTFLCNKQPPEPIHVTLATNLFGGIAIRNSATA